MQRSSLRAKSSTVGNWAVHWVMKSLSVAAVWMRWLCLCLPVTDKGTCKRTLCLPAIWYHHHPSFYLLFLYSSSSTPCCLCVFITHNIPSIILSPSLSVSLFFYSPSTPSRSQGLPFRSARSSFLSFLCHRLQPHAHPTPCLWEQLRGNKTEKTVQLASWVRKE